MICPECRNGQYKPRTICHTCEGCGEICPECAEPLDMCECGGPTMYEDNEEDDENV